MRKCKVCDKKTTLAKCGRCSSCIKEDKELNGLYFRRPHYNSTKGYNTRQDDYNGFY